ncbi:putative DBH-like monooxygenase protein 2 [Ambystoma mexicanum]|uniref:putative DBH-like monooxygenase protein 2 n=1 Tax=Ambystoma mexicanum TaxID=8296 RepID=UPI0037E7039A
MSPTALVVGLYFLPLALAQLPALRFSQVLDTQGAVLLRWDFNTSRQEVTFELQVQTTGWVGFGLSPKGTMAGADMVIAGVNPSAYPPIYFSGYHGIGEVPPVLDNIQSDVLLLLSENGTHTTMRFSRKFRTCDPFGVDITTDTQRVIAAYGMTDTLAYHGPNHRFVKSVLLLQETSLSAGPPPVPTFSHDMKMTNFSVPSAATTYGCTFIPLPSVSVKHHIYKFEVTVQSGNEDLVHHILLYSCPNATNITSAAGNCYGDDPTFYQCSQVFIAWALGGEPFTFPSNAGISLGTAVDPLFVRIEVHYNNQLMQSGRVDSSGIRLHYTPVLREHDVGILEAGTVQDPVIFIPPRAESYRVYGVCKTAMFPQATGQPVPEMQMFAVMLHSHLAGRAIQVAQYRNGTQIAFLGRDMTYDFDLQATRYLPNVTTVQMGDELMVECTYNTMDRSNITFGGLSTMEEMCLGFLYYYPRNTISTCLSFPNNTHVSSALGLSVEGYPANLNTSSWTPTNIQKAQTATKEALQIIIVLKFDGNITVRSGMVRNITDPPIPPCKSSESNNSSSPSSSAPMATSPMPAATTMPALKLPSAGYCDSSDVIFLTFFLSVLSLIFPFMDF